MNRVLRCGLRGFSVGFVIGWCLTTLSFFVAAAGAHGIPPDWFSLLLKEWVTNPSFWIGGTIIGIIGGGAAAQTAFYRERRR